jgi:hypothetical protein
MATPRVENPIGAAARSARARSAANARHALGPSDMAAARAGVFRKFLETIDAIAPGLEESERETRAGRLRSSWLSTIALERSMRKRGREPRDLDLDAWLSERMATAERIAAKKAAPTKNGTAQEERDATAPASNRS